MIDEEIKRLESIVIPPKMANPILERYETTPVATGIRLSEMI